MDKELVKMGTGIMTQLSEEARHATWLGGGVGIWENIVYNTFYPSDPLSSEKESLIRTWIINQMRADGFKPNSSNHKFMWEVYKLKVNKVLDDSL